MPKQLIGVRASASRWLDFQLTKARGAVNGSYVVLRAAAAKMVVLSHDGTLETEYRWLSSDEAGLGIRWTDIIRLEDSMDPRSGYDSKFFMIYGEGGSTPAVKHTTFAAASDEADRLARANPNRRFVILQAVEIRTVAQPAVQRISLS